MEAFSKILGGSSIKLLQMRYKVKDAFGQRVPLEVLPSSVRVRSMMRSMSASISWLAHAGGPPWSVISCAAGSATADSTFRDGSGLASGSKLTGGKILYLEGGEGIWLSFGVCPVLFELDAIVVVNAKMNPELTFVLAFVLPSCARSTP